MDEPHKHYAKGKKLETKDFTFIKIHLYDISKRKTCIDSKKISGCFRLGMGGGTDCKCHRDSLGMINPSNTGLR